jgi:uncharacterized protein YbjT (DUF2867 family)
MRMAEARPLLLFGATGLVGGECLQQALQQGHAVIAPTRRALPKHPSLTNPVITMQPERLAEDLALQAGISEAICCLGTTIKEAGSPDAFRRIDVDLVLAAGRAAYKNGCNHMLVVSSVGADQNARNFYLRCKGDMEVGLSALGFVRLDIMRPGLLIGPRNSKRPGEAISQMLLPLLDPILIGGLRKYRTIYGRDVALSLLKQSRETAPGHFVHHFEDMHADAKRFS